MKEILMNVIDDFKKAKLIVVGDAILDTYIITTPEKFCREAPVPVFHAHDYIHECGGAANTAVNAATLGAEIYFVTVTGKDAASKHLFEILKKNKVHTDYIIRDKSRTTVAKKRVTASSNILFRIDEGTTTGIGDKCSGELLRNLSEIYAYADAIVISDYENGVMTEAVIDGIRRLSEKHNIPVIVDAKDVGKYKMLRPAAVKPNYEEAIHALKIEKVSGSKRVRQMFANSQKLFDITGANQIAVTLDADGVVYLERDKPPFHLPCTPHENKNSIGAGDTFTSAFAVARALKEDGRLALEIACAAAAVVIEKEGTAGCTNSELKNYFSDIQKLISRTEELVKIVKEQRKYGKKIVFTNGCFDILHTGHIALLNNARKAGDVLIVGVNSDAGIRKLKGAGRPINSFKDRITVLAGLESVDYLIAFDEDSPVQLIKAIQPDIFIKGGNYTEASIPEAPVLKKMGCTVKIVPYIEEHSTTHIIDRIREIKSEKEILLQI